MSSLNRMKWTELKADLEAGLREGIVALKKGALVVKKKAGELTEEGKRRYKILSLKTKVHQGIADLGARVYSLLGGKGKNPALDAKVKDIAAQIRRYEAEIASLEKSERKRSGKPIKKNV